jgi:hypothetical protein
MTMTVTSTSIANSVAAHAEEIASAMAIYHTEPEGGKVREDIVASVEVLRKRLQADWLRLVLRHKAEAFEAECAQIEQEGQGAPR